MKLKTITNENLVKNLKNLVSEEKKLIKQVLEYLEEVDNRKLYLKMAYSTLFAFCSEYLGYTPQEAQTRIHAMRLARKLPEIKDKIENGSISLCLAAKVQSHVARDKKNPLSTEDTKTIIEAVENKSVRASEKILLEFFPEHEVHTPNRVKQVGVTTLRFEVNLPEETFQQLERVRNLRAHANPTGDWALVLKDLCELAIKKWDLTQRGVTPLETQERVLN